MVKILQSKENRGSELEGHRVPESHGTSVERSSVSLLAQCEVRSLSTQWIPCREGLVFPVMVAPGL